MADRKYSEDIPKEIQDLFFDKNRSTDDVLRSIRENYDISTNEALLAKCTEIRRRVWKLNPELVPRFEQKTGCLLFVAALIVFGVVGCLPDEIWESNIALPTVLTAVGVALVLCSWYAAGVKKKHFVQMLNPQAKELPEIMPKASKLINCKTCGKEVSQTAPTCPHCGESLPGVRVTCPKCTSTNIQIGEKGYGALKGAVGSLILGPGGLLIGFHGRKDVELKCLSCGNKWKPEEKLG